MAKQFPQPAGSAGAANRAQRDLQAVFSKGREADMAKKVKQSDVSTKTEQLRALRLAHEESRKAEGTWGQMTVGEIVHEPTHAVFIEVWKGPQRPDPFRAGAAKGRGVSAGDWSALTVWVSAHRIAEFDRSVVARNITEDAAQDVVRLRSAERLAAGYRVMNPAGAGQTSGNVALAREQGES